MWQPCRNTIVHFDYVTAFKALISQNFRKGSGQSIVAFVAASFTQSALNLNIEIYHFQWECHMS